MDLFKIVPDNFFSLLSSKNKAIYAGCIMEAFKIYEEGSILGIDKKLVVEVLTDYLDREKFDLEELDDALFDSEEESKQPSVRDRANFVLRKMEDCGWIDIDVTNDYVEILNFRDYAITVIEAFLQIQPNYEYDDISTNQHEYRGYIYTIYSLLTNPMNIEYGVLMEQVYRNTKLFIRELRKLDSRLKDYIKAIIDRSEIKDLMESLIDYKVELVDKAYHRLKTSDNVNKYRLEIVNRLNHFLEDEEIMRQITASYRARFADYDDAYQRVSRDINEIVDIFNSLDEMITEIDAKNKTYINSTIGKIEFLLKDDNNIPGKISVILKHISLMNKRGKIDSAINMVQPIFKLKSFRSLNEASLYTPRGSYAKPEAQRLLMEKGDITDIQNAFFKEYESVYTQEKVLKFVDDHLTDNKLQASSLITDDSTIDDVLMIIYALIYANSNDDVNYRVIKLDSLVNSEKFKFNDFMIEKEEM